MAPPKKPPPPPSGRERRSTTRYDIMAQVEIKAAGEVVVLPIGNISGGGLSLTFDRLDTARRTFRIGDKVSVFLALDDKHTLTMDAKVIRFDLGAPGRPPGVGLAWASQDAEANAALSRILARLVERADAEGVRVGEVGGVGG